MRCRSSVLSPGVEERQLAPILGPEMPEIAGDLTDFATVA